MIDSYLAEAYSLAMCKLTNSCTASASLLLFRDACYCHDGKTQLSSSAAVVLLGQGGVWWSRCCSHADATACFSAGRSGRLGASGICGGDCLGAFQSYCTSRRSCPVAGVRPSACTCATLLPCSRRPMFLNITAIAVTVRSDKSVILVVD